MKDQTEIILVDDDDDVLTAGHLLLSRAYGRVRAIKHPREIGSRGAAPRLILLDMNFGPGQTSGEQGLHWLARLLKQDPDEVVIMVTAHGDLGTAVEAMKRGACDFVTKPWHNEQLLATVDAGATLASTRFEAGAGAGPAAASVVSASAQAPTIIGASPSMQRVMELVALAAPVDANVLVLGENGTGKDLVARAVHQASRRAQGPFVAVDLGAVPETLFESELFGHKRGAFTDARSDRTGRMVSASGGTLFLDEIGNVPLAAQAKLLGALEQRRVTPVGATRSEPFDVRLIAATNLPPTQLADPQVFRQDLLFRLNTIEIVLPPLRERTDDIPALVRHYLPYYEERYGRAKRSLDEAVLAELATHPWPGNVRALRHAVERAVIMARGDGYAVADFSLPATAQAAAAPPAMAGPDEELNLEVLERRAVAAALKKHAFNISRAAKELGLTRAALYRRMEKHGL